MTDTRTNAQKIDQAALILARNPRIYPHDAESVRYRIKHGDGARALAEALFAASRPRSCEQYAEDQETARAEARQNCCREDFEP